MTRRVLAFGTYRVPVLTTIPNNPFAPTVSELADAKMATCIIRHSGFEMGATDPTTQDTTGLCDPHTTNTPTLQNFQCSFTYDLYFDEEGHNLPTGETSDDEQRELHAIFSSFNQEIWVGKSVGKDHDAPFVAGDVFEVGGVWLTTGARSSSSEDFHRVQTSLNPRRIRSNVEVASSGGGGS